MSCRPNRAGLIPFCDVEHDVAQILLGGNDSLYLLVHDLRHWTPVKNNTVSHEAQLKLPSRTQNEPTGQE